MHEKRRCFRQYGTLGDILGPLVSLERHRKSAFEGTCEELMLESAIVVSANEQVLLSEDVNLK